MAKTFGICSGKGGVGKTFCAVNLARFLSNLGKRVLLVDCDFNLGNCGFLLGLRGYRTLVDFSKSQNAKDCITKTESFDFVGAESGDLEVLENSVNLTESLLKLILFTQKNYDYIILDFGAGLDEKLLSILAYCDKRFVVLNSDKLSIKDSYALIKVLKQKYGVVDFDILPNSIRSNFESKKLEKIFQEMNDRFLQVNLTFLNKINFVESVPDFSGRKSLGESVAANKEFSHAFKYLDEKDDDPGIPFWIKPEKQDAFFERLRSN